MEIGDAPDLMPRPGWEPVRRGARCAFCHQELDDPVRTSCFRCHTLYHADCWDANGARCAVYGCDPTRTVPSRRLRRGAHGRPAADALRERSADSLPILFLFLVLIGGMLVSGMWRGSHPGRSSRPIVEEFYPAFRTDPAASREYATVGDDARQFLNELEERGGLPTDPDHRFGIQWEADILAARLRRALDVTSRNEVEGTEALERARDWTDSLRRLDRLNVDLQALR